MADPKMTAAKSDDEVTLPPKVTAAPTAPKKAEAPAPAPVTVEEEAKAPAPAEEEAPSGFISAATKAEMEAGKKALANR